MLVCDARDFKERVNRARVDRARAGDDAERTQAPLLIALDCLAQAAHVQTKRRVRLY